MKKIILSIIFSLCIMQESSSSNPFDHMKYEQSCEEFVKAYMIKLQYIHDEYACTDPEMYKHCIALLEKTHKQDLERCHEFISKSQ